MSKKVKNNTYSPREKQLYGELRRLKRELSDAREGAQELSRALDGVVAAIVRQCGTGHEGGYVLRLPAVRLREKYSVGARQDGDFYVITAQPVGQDDPALPDSGGEDMQPVG